MSSLEKETNLEDFNNVFRLDGKIALVTGGSRGLGLTVASGFLQAGCITVFIVSRKADACQAAADVLNGLPNKSAASRAIPIAADLSKMSEINRLVSEVTKVTLHIDLLFANAGASWGARFEDQPEAAFTKVLDLNVKSIFYTVQKMQPLLRKRAVIGNPSTVIINSSAAGIAVGTLGENGTHPYSISKAAAIHLGKILAIELGPRAINTNVICPGFFPTKMSSGLIDLEGGLSGQAARSPNGRLGRPEDIAGLVVFLASRGASHINGAVITVDGGAHLGGGKL